MLKEIVATGYGVCNYIARGLERILISYHCKAGADTVRVVHIYLNDSF